MIRFFLILCALSIGISAHAAEILIVKEGSRHNAALKSFRGECRAVTSVLDSSNMERFDVVRYITRMAPLPPRVILAVGSNALSKVDQSKIPIVYMMVTDTSPYQGRKNITGISMGLPALEQIKAYKDTIPSMERIGVVYTYRTAHLVEEARKFPGIELVAREIPHPKESVPAMMDVFAKGLDGYWALLDPGVYYEEMLSYLYELSFRSRKPILTTIPRVMHEAAVVSLEVDPLEMGKEAGRMVRDVLDGHWPEPVTANFTIRTNELIAGKMNISLKQTRFAEK